MARNSIADIAAAVAHRHNLGKKESADIVTEFFKIISEGLKTDKIVKVRGLGTFKVTYVKARESVNVNTGERVTIEGHDKVTFVPDATMKEIVNKPFSQFSTVVVNDGVNFDSIDIAAEAEEQKQASEEQKEADEEQKETAEEQTETPADEEETNVDETKDAPEVQEDTVAEEPKSTVAAPTKKYEDAKAAEPAPEKVADIPSEKPSEVEKSTENEPKPAASDDNTKSDVTPEVKEDKPETPEDPSEKTENVVKKKVVDHEIVKQEVVEQKIVRTTNTSDEEDKVSREYFDEQMHRLHRHHNIFLAIAGVLIVLGVVVGLLLGRYFAQGTQQPATVVHDTIESKPAPTAVAAPKAEEEFADTAQTPKTASPEPAKKLNENPSKADLERINSDRRLRYGAYKITGVSKKIVLKKGQTMSSYSDKYFGKDMIVYFQALNGVEEMSEGDTMLVPEVKLRAQIRRR